MIRNISNHIILCVTNDLSQDQRMKKTAESLSLMGNDVTLVGRRLKDSLQLTEREFNQKRLKCWINKGALFYLEYNIRLFFFLLLAKQVKIITACDLDTLGAVFLAAKIKGVSKIFDAHEYFVEVPELANKRFKKGVWAMLERIVVHRMDKCYTVNDSLSQIFNKRLNTNFEVVENWPKYSDEFINASFDNNIFLYQGVLNEGRGLEEIARVMKHFIEYELWIIGKGVLKKKLIQIIKENNLEKRVKLLGFIPPNELSKYTSQAFLGLNLLTAESLNYFYSSANKCFDYIQHELPSINMEYPEYVRLNKKYDVSILIDTLDEKSIIQAINKLMNKSTYKKMQSNCKIAKHNFIWSMNEPTIKKIYKIEN